MADTTLTPLPRSLPMQPLTAAHRGLGHPDNVRARIAKMEHLLEGIVPLPFGRRAGLDVILDLLPVGGSAVAAAMGAWILWEARNLGVSKWTVAKMAGNVGLDFLLGAIPFVGAVPDFFFRSNTRNVRLLKRWMDDHPATADVQPG